jgi:hypothetical protein
MAMTTSVYCADIGSVAANNFGWFGLGLGDRPETGVSMPGLAEAVAAVLRGERPVALGFECPLFVPIRQRPVELTSGRPGDGNRAWSAGAGCGALATGLVQVVWLLREIRRLVGGARPAFLEWESFVRHGSGLFVWEAFVSGKAKGAGHLADAQVAVEAFRHAVTQPTVASAVTATEETYSLIGAALLRSGWSSDLAILANPCLVVRADPRAV